MWLLIDDIRNLDVDVIARTPEEGRDQLLKGGWDGVCFDHDLGFCESGYSVLVWALDNNLLPLKVQLVTSNPVGRYNMTAALENAGYITKDGYNFNKGV